MNLSISESIPRKDLASCVKLSGIKLDHPIVCWRDEQRRALAYRCGLVEWSIPDFYRYRNVGELFDLEVKTAIKALMPKHQAPSSVTHKRNIQLE